jgi:hypothetical protein
MMMQPEAAPHSRGVGTLKEVKGKASTRKRIGVNPKCQTLKLLSGDI